MSRTGVRIGGASAFINDSCVAARQLLDRGRPDYLVFDYLAEVTLAILAKVEARRPGAGHAREFVSLILDDILSDAVERGVRIVANAGGLDVRACARAVEELAREKGVAVRIGIVEGDDLRPRLDALRAADVRDLDSGAPMPERMLTANAYLGAAPIAAALDAGAEIVLTGRVVDSALTLGPLIHELGWALDDWDRLAAGSLAGHVIECGAQATGGLFTDWEQVPDWTDIGYPILECEADGSFVVTKPEGTGGLVTPATVGEQLLYEIGDPQAYLLPDVVCDFSRVELRQEGADRVRVSGARGRPASGFYKVCGTWQDGWRSMAVAPVIGRDARRKAERQAEALLERTRRLFAERDLGDYRRSRVECLGAEAAYGPHSRIGATREVVCKIGVEHDSREALELFARESSSPVTSMAVGGTGWFASGRPTVSSVVRLFSFLLPRGEVPVTIEVGGEQQVIEPAPTPGFDPSTVERPGVAAAPAPDDPVRVPLIALAWGRSGDKGNRFNVGVIARRPEYLPWIVRALDEETVADVFAHHFDHPNERRVERFALPGMHALNFVVHEALGGGGMGSLRVDPLAKSMAQQLLDMPIPVPRELAERDDLERVTED